MIVLVVEDKLPMSRYYFGMGNFETGNFGKGPKCFSCYFFRPYRGRFDHSASQPAESPRTTVSD